METTECQLTEASLREDLDAAILYLEGVLDGFGEPVPPRARECLSADVLFADMLLVYNAGAAELRKALGRLRLMREDFRRGESPELTATSLARALVELEPFAAECPEGEMGRLTRNGKPLARLINPILFPVRGVERGVAERKLAWLFGQLGVPAGDRSEAPSGAAERRAA